GAAPADGGVSVEDAAGVRLRAAAVRRCLRGRAVLEPVRSLDRGSVQSGHRDRLRGRKFLPGESDDPRPDVGVPPADAPSAVTAHRTSPMIRRALPFLGVGLAFAAQGQAQTFGLMHRFGGPDSPRNGLILGADGYLYGTTPGGGEVDAGTVFRAAAGTFVRVHEFRYTEGAAPSATLLPANDGYLYGTAAGGGASNLGTVFRMDLSGNVTRLHSFSGPDGSRPTTALIQAGDGMFYGTTATGGVADQGTVF